MAAAMKAMSLPMLYVYSQSCKLQRRLVSVTNVTTTTTAVAAARTTAPISVNRKRRDIMESRGGTPMTGLPGALVLFGHSMGLRGKSVRQPARP